VLKVLPLDIVDKTRLIFPEPNVTCHRNAEFSIVTVALQSPVPHIITLCHVAYKPKLPFLISDIRALWRSELKNGRLARYGAEHTYARCIHNESRKCIIT